MDTFHAVYILMKINIITECYLKIITEIVLNHFFILVMIIFVIGFVLLIDLECLAVAFGK